MKTRLPETIDPGAELEIQIAPHGSFPGLLKIGDKITRVSQRCLPADLQRVADSFTGEEILVDRDHTSDAPDGSTEAQAWITALRHDPATGLMATVKFTDIGAAAVTNRRFRFTSPVFQIVQEGSDTAVPVGLLSLALTNKPNLPVGCVLNSAQAASVNHVEERNPSMDKIITLLALPPEADEAAVLEAITALQKQVAEAAAAAEAAQAEALKAEAETVATDNASKIANRDDFVKLYVANRDIAKQILATVKAAPPAVPPRVTNSAAGRAPVVAPATDVLTAYNSLKGAERRKFLRDNATEIDAARKATAS